jgi:hypothetical protein
MVDGALTCWVCAILRVWFAATESCAPGAFHGKLADIWAAAVSLYFFVHGKW